MCDTMGALADSTCTGGALFKKNSDRLKHEPQVVEIVPAEEHDAGAELNCTYITIPQVRLTQRLLLSRPHWIWGAEMGANAHGVAIGNEAVFGRLAPNREPALLGIDLLRLGRERSTPRIRGSRHHHSARPRFGASAREGRPARRRRDDGDTKGSWLGYGQ